MNIVEDLKLKYKAGNDHPDALLGNAWQGSVVDRHSFSLGELDRKYVEAIDEFLSWVYSKQPSFKIKSIKHRHGKTVIDLGLSSSDRTTAEIRRAVAEMEIWLSTPSYLPKLSP